MGKIKAVLNKLSFSRKTFKIWAFSNENLSLITNKIDCSGLKMGGIGGPGDQPLTFLGLGAETYFAVDNRRPAVRFLNLKKAMVANLSRAHFIEAFKGKVSSRSLYRAVKKGLPQLEKSFWRQYLDREGSFLHCLKRSGLFYNYSFRNLQRRDFFPYLKEEQIYKKARNKIDSLKVSLGSIEEYLQTEKEFGGIFLSNVLDSAFQRKIYLEDADSVIESSREALTSSGFILLASLESKNLIKVFNKHRLRVTNNVSPTLPLIYYLFTFHYPYSLMVVRKN